MRCSFGFIGLFFISAIAGKPGISRIVLTDSTIISCECAEGLLDCDALDRFVKRQPRIPAPLLTRNFLDSLGFFHAKWDTLARKRFAVTLDERAIIVSESVKGATSVSLDSLPPLRLPRVYDAGELNDRISAMGRYFAERGYPFAAISVTIEQPRKAASPTTSIPGGDSLAVIYMVDTDRKCLFAAPRLVGITATRPNLLLHDVSIRRGELFDIRKIELTQQQLDRRPYVEAVYIGKFAVEPDALRESDEPGDIDYIAVPVILKDRSGLGIEGAIGFASREGAGKGLQGDLTLSFLNLLHSGENAFLSYAGDRTYQKIRTEVSKPWLLGSPLTGLASFDLEIHENKYGYLAGEAAAIAELRKGWNFGVKLKGSEAVSDSAGTDSNEKTWRYGGADLLLARFHGRPADGIFSHELSLATGGGIAKRERNYGRSHIDFTAGAHIPLWRRHATRIRFVSKHLITEEEKLIDAEMYRVGGSRSVRGYSENEFAFRTVLYNQLEYLLYFNPTGSAYIFMDGGFGFGRSPGLSRWSERRDFFGYGLGIRVPARLGTLSLEWARNIGDTKSWGRAHVMVRNSFHTETE